jgi:hypothetical protein
LIKATFNFVRLIKGMGKKGRKKAKKGSQDKKLSNKMRPYGFLQNLLTDRVPSMELVIS